MAEWYPSTEQELEKLVSYFISQKPKLKVKQINGLIVPHAGYAYSGEIAGKAFSLLKSLKPKKALILGPSHYTPLKGLASLEINSTPLGQVYTIKNMFPKIPYEHSIQNQIPFLQKINPEIEILPLVVGQINETEAKEISIMLLSNYPLSEFIYIFSSDLSHFLSYNEAKQKDARTIEIISQLDLKQAKKLDACGIYPLLVFMQLAIQKGLKPELIEYKNSGDITGDKSAVVGYSSWVF